MQLRTAAAAASTLVVIAAAAALLTAQRGGSLEVPRPQVPGTHSSLAAADITGAVVQDPDRRAIDGYLASGERIWTTGGGTGSTPAVIQCLSSCPDAHLSGADDTVNRPELADPPMEWRTGSGTTTEPAGIPGHGPGKTRVSAASSQQRAVLVQSDLRGNAQLQMRDRPRPDLDVPVPVPGPDVIANRPLSAAIALFPPTDPSTGEREYRWYVLESTGWVEARRGTTSALTGCVDASGDRAVLRGGQAELIERKSGRRTRIPAEPGDCAFNRVGPVLTTFWASSAGSTTLVAQYDSSGREKWQHTLDIGGSPTVVPDSDLVGVWGGGRFEVYGKGGASVLSLTDVASGLLVAPRRAVVLTLDGKLGWRDLPADPTAAAAAAPGLGPAGASPEELSVYGTLFCLARWLRPGTRTAARPALCSPE